jgi:AcrR family transcriptional regulator
MSTQNRPAETRRYTSAVRSEQAAATRTRIVEAASALFAARGYAGTSIPEIARSARVSAETVHAHGPKAALLRAAIDASAFGAERDADARDTELGSRMLAARSGAEAAELAASVLTQVNATVHGLWLALSEAARTDDELARELSALGAGIRMQNELMMRSWSERGFLRDDVAWGELVDRAVLVSSVELYDRAVRVGGMTTEAYRVLLASLLRESLIAP